MLTSHVQKIARVLNILVLITFICNLAALPLVPGLVLFRFNLEKIQSLWTYDWDDCLGNFSHALVTWWTRGEPYTIVLTLFLLFAGICTAVILWQGHRVLGTDPGGGSLLFGKCRLPPALRRQCLCNFRRSPGAAGIQHLLLPLPRPPADL